MRKNSYKFFQNKECEYFPCHKVDSGDELLQVNIGKLREDIWERMAQIASWEKMDKEMYREHRVKAIHNIATVLEKYKYLYHVPVLLQPFSAECIQDGYFQFGSQKIPCQVLAKIDRSQVETGYFYTFHAPEWKVEEDDALLKQYYFEIFRIACLDVIRDWLQGGLTRKHSVLEERYCSPAFGPGFYGMELEAAETLLSLMNADKAGVSYENGAMHPAMSVVGIYLVSKEDVLPVCRDCEHCIGQKGGCAFCGNYTR